MVFCCSLCPLNAHIIIFIWNPTHSALQAGLTTLTIHPETHLMKSHSIVDEALSPLNSKDENYRNEMFDLLNDSFPSQSTDHSGATAVVMKLSQMKLQQHISSESFQHEHKQPQDCTDAGMGLSRDSCETCYSHDDERTTTTDWLGIPEHLDKNWNDVIFTLYETAIEAYEYVLKDFSDVSNDFIQKFINNAENNMERSISLVEEPNGISQSGQKIDDPFSGEKTDQTREEHRIRFKTKLSKMDTMTAHKFKLMLMKQKLRREKKSIQQSDPQDGEIF